MATMLARRALPAPASRCSPPPPVPGRYRGVARPRVRTAAFEPPGGMDPVSAGVDVSSDAYGIKGLPNALTSTVLASWYNKTVGGPHVLMNLVGEQTGDLSLGPLSIKYAVETDSQHVRLVAKLGSQSIVTSGERGSFKLADGDSSVDATFQVTSTGLQLEGTNTQGDNSIVLEGKALYWPEVLTIKPGLASEVEKPRDDTFPGRTYINAALRDPYTLKSAGLAVTRSIFEAGTTAPPHNHMADTVRIIIEGKVRFTIYDPDGGIAKFVEAGPGDVVNMPGGTVYGEEVLEKAKIITGRLISSLHYRDPTN